MQKPQDILKTKQAVRGRNHVRVFESTTMNENARAHNNHA